MEIGVNMYKKLNLNTFLFRIKYILLILFLLSFKKDNNIIDIKYNNYYVKYDMNNKIPLYTYYRLYYLKSIDNTYNRTSFKLDPNIDSKYQQRSYFYKNSLYDRGHLSPNDDFKNDSISQIQSMYYTNCFPQNRNMNRGIWKSLENRVRYLSKKYNYVDVYTGVVFYEDSKKLNSLIYIPNYVWKVIIYDNKYEAYILENKGYENKNFSKYRVSIDSISSISRYNIEFK